MAKKRLKPYDLKWIPYWLFKVGQKNDMKDPHGMGRETADGIVCFSETKKDIKDTVKEIKIESQQTFLSEQNKKYYHSLLSELDSYYKKSEKNLDMYRRCKK